MKKPLSFIITILIILGIFWFAYKKAKIEPPVIPPAVKTEVTKTPPKKEWPCDPAIYKC